MELGMVSKTWQATTVVKIDVRQDLTWLVNRQGHSPKGSGCPRPKQTYKGTTLGPMVQARHGYKNIQGLATTSTGSGSYERI